MINFEELDTKGKMGFLKRLSNNIQKAKEALQEKLTKPKEEPRYNGIAQLELEQKKEYAAMLKIMNKNLIKKVNDYAEPTTNK